MDRRSLILLAIFISGFFIWFFTLQYAGSDTGRGTPSFQEGVEICEEQCEQTKTLLEGLNHSSEDESKTERILDYCQTGFAVESRRSKGYKTQGFVSPVSVYPGGKVHCFNLKNHTCKIEGTEIDFEKCEEAICNYFDNNSSELAQENLENITKEIFLKGVERRKSTEALREKLIYNRTVMMEKIKGINCIRSNRTR